MNRFFLRSCGPYQQFSFCIFPSSLLSSVPPSIIGQVELPENVSVVVKNPVALSCEASGIPLPVITWLKDGQPIKASSSVRVLSGEFAQFTHVVTKQAPILTYWASQ